MIRQYFVSDGSKPRELALNGWLDSADRQPAPGGVRRERQSQRIRRDEKPSHGGARHD